MFLMYCVTRGPLRVLMFCELLFIQPERVASILRVKEDD